MTNADVVKKLIGSIDPYGSTHIDNERMENLKEMCNLVESLVIDIAYVSNSKDRHEASMKNMGEKAEMFLKYIVDEIGEYVELK